MNKTLWLAGASLALFATTPALAATSAASATDVSEVVVTARSLEDVVPADLAKSGVRVSVITDKAIRNGNYVDISQSLQALAPGLYIQSKNGPFDYVDVSLQGSRTEDVLWLIDGVRINNRLYAGTTPLDTLPSSMVDRIEVLEGGQALFYGTSAIAGAINVVTRPFSKTPEGRITVAGDTNRGRHLDAFFGDSIGKSQFVVYGSADKSDGYLAFRPQDYQPSSTHRRRGYQVLTLGAKYAYDVTDDLRFSASYQHTDADLDYAQPFRVARDVNSRKEDLATVKIDYQAMDRLSLYLKGYWHNWDTHYDTFYNDLAVPGTLDKLYENAFWGFKDYGVNALGKFEFAKGVETYFGYDLQKYGGRDEVLVIEQHDETTNAVFGQLRLTPDLIPRVNLAAGVRYNHPSVGESATIWNVSGKFDVTDNLFLRGEAGTNFRLPTAEELFANDPLDERGNPNLKPEKSRSFNASLGGHFGEGDQSLRWEVIGFLRYVDNLIDYDQFDPVTQQDVFGNVPGTVKVKGAEIVLDASLNSAVSANFNYTYSSTKQDGGVQLSRIPQHVLKGSLDFHPVDLPIGATATVTYTGKETIGLAGVSTPYGNYAILDLSGRYFLDSARHHEFSLSLQNVFNTAYGQPRRGCADVSTDGPYDCSVPYVYVNRGLPRTLRASYSYSF